MISGLAGKTVESTWENLSSRQSGDIVTQTSAGCQISIVAIANGNKVVHLSTVSKVCNTDTKGCSEDIQWYLHQP